MILLGVRAPRHCRRRTLGRDAITLDMSQDYSRPRKVENNEPARGGACDAGEETPAPTPRLPVSTVLMTAPYWTDGQITLYHGDCRERFANP